MKTKLFFLNLIVIAAICTSCGGSYIEPTEKDLNDYISALSHYYPYSINDDFVFRNDDLGRIWENKPFTCSGDSIYPETEIWLCNDPFASCYGDRYACVSAYFMENGVSRNAYDPSNLITYIAKSGSVDVYISWDVFLSFGAYDYFRGSFNSSCKPQEVLSQLSDTIIIPIQRQGTASGVIDAPDDAYARIIKDQGLTDFSTDGKTIWKRIQ